MIPKKKFEPVTKTVEDTIEKQLEHTESATKILGVRTNIFHHEVAFYTICCHYEVEDKINDPKREFTISPFQLSPFLKKKTNALSSKLRFQNDSQFVSLPDEKEKEWTHFIFVKKHDEIAGFDSFFDQTKRFDKVNMNLGKMMKVDPFGKFSPEVGKNHDFSQ